MPPVLALAAEPTLFMSVLHKMCGNAALGFGKDEVGGVRCDLQDHVAGMKSDFCIWVGVQVVHKHGGVDGSVSGRLGLVGGEFRRAGRIQGLQALK